MGKRYSNAYEQFNQELSIRTKRCFNEIKKICEIDSAKKDLFELCKSIVDIGLNSKKWKTEDNQVQAIFLDTDINIAKEKVIEFVEKYKINELESFFDSVEELYHYTTEWRDKRATSVVLFDKAGVSKWDSQRTGVYFSFSKLPDDIWNKIKEDIMEELNK